MKKILSAIALALTLTLVVPVAAPQTAVVASAATKTKKTTLSSKSATIAICGTKTISLKNKNSKASYSFSSNKKSVATVSSKGVVTGKAAGTANITVKQKLKGKTTTVGTFKVTVKKAVVNSYEASKENDNWIWAQPGWVSKNNPSNWGKATDYIKYRNPKAKYFWYTDGKDVVMTKDGKVTDVKKSGIRTGLTIKETYKGKTRVVGKVSVALADPYFDVNHSAGYPLYIGETLHINDFLYCCDRYNLQISEQEFSSDEEIISTANDSEEKLEGDLADLVTDEDGGLGIKAKAAGTLYCVLTQYNYKTKKYDKVFAKFTLTIVDPSILTDYKMEWETEDWYPDYGVSYKENQLDLYPEDTDYEDDWYDKKDVYYFKIDTTPEKYTGNIEVVSSDPSVVEASLGSEDEYQYLNRPLKLVVKEPYSGQATVTVKAGDIEKKFTVVVHKGYSDEEDYDDYDDYDDEEDW